MCYNTSCLACVRCYESRGLFRCIRINEDDCNTALDAWKIPGSVYNSTARFQGHTHCRIVTRYVTASSFHGHTVTDRVVLRYFYNDINTSSYKCNPFRTNSDTVVSLLIPHLSRQH